MLKYLYVFLLYLCKNKSQSVVKMKIKTLFTISILVLAVLIITGSCITLLTPLLHLQAEKGNLLRVKKVNRGRGRM